MDFTNDYIKLCERSLKKNMALDSYSKIDNGLRMVYEDTKNKERISKDEFVYYIETIRELTIKQDEMVSNLEHIFDDTTIIDSVFYDFEEFVAKVLMSKATSLNEEEINNEYCYALECGIFTNSFSTRIIIDGVEYCVNNVGDWYDYLMKLTN